MLKTTFCRDYDSMMPHNAPYASSFFHKGEYTGESANVSRILDSFTSRNGYDKRLRPGYKGKNIIIILCNSKRKRRRRIGEIIFNSKLRFRLFIRIWMMLIADLGGGILPSLSFPNLNFFSGAAWSNLGFASECDTIITNSCDQRCFFGIHFWQWRISMGIKVWKYVKRKILCFWRLNSISEFASLFVQLEIHLNRSKNPVTLVLTHPCCVVLW